MLTDMFYAPSRPGLAATLEIRQAGDKQEGFPSIGRVFPAYPPKEDIPGPPSILFRVKDEYVLHCMILDKKDSCIVIMDGILFDGHLIESPV